MMAKKKSPESPEDQVKRFEAEVQRLIDAGELNPIETETKIDNLIRKLEINQNKNDQNN